MSCGVAELCYAAPPHSHRCHSRIRVSQTITSQRRFAVSGWSIASSRSTKRTDIYPLWSRRQRNEFTVRSYACRLVSVKRSAHLCALRVVCISLSPPRLERNLADATSRSSSVSCNESIVCIKLFAVATTRALSAMSHHAEGSRQAIAAIRMSYNAIIAAVRALWISVRVVALLESACIARTTEREDTVGRC